MVLAFDSLTGNVRRLAHELAALTGAVPLDVRTGRSPAPPEGVLLLTYTAGQGQVAPSTAAFLETHSPLVRGVVASGSYHWGPHFARAADVIAARYGVPVVARVNKGGTAADRAHILTWIKEHTDGTLD